MGMAASQARLLCITARLHDVEFEAQSIQNAKLQLATQSDQVYQEYLEALDATTLTVKAFNNGETSTIPVNFNNLFSRNKIYAADGSNYALTNAENLLIVEDEIEEGYDVALSNGYNAHQFALYMMGYDPNYEDNGGNRTNSTNSDLPDNSPNGNSSPNGKRTTEDGGKGAYNKPIPVTPGSGEEQKPGTGRIPKPDPEPEPSLVTPPPAPGPVTPPDPGLVIPPPPDPDPVTPGQNVPPLPEGADRGLYNYFVGIFKQICACGGCVSIAEYNGGPGDAANNTAWLQNMIKSGQFTLHTVTYDEDSGAAIFDATSPSSDTCLNYTTTTEIDKTALAKAEAKYEHDLKLIDKKDKRFDLDLTKLDTERNALKTQMDALKNVIKDNVDRSFGIFS